MISSICAHHLPRHFVYKRIDPGLGEARHQLVDDLLHEQIVHAGAGQFGLLEGEPQVAQLGVARAGITSLHLQENKNLFRNLKPTNQTQELTSFSRGKMIDLRQPLLVLLLLLLLVRLLPLELLFTFVILLLLLMLLLELPLLL